MRNMRRFPVVGAFVVLMMVGFGASPGTAQSRAHVYLLRGLMNIFSLGMDTLWPAPGSADTELGVLMEPEVCHGETEVYTGVQA